MFTKADIEKYFMAEKQSGLLFLIIGVVVIVIAVVFVAFLKTSFYKGAAVPLLLIGIIQLAVGYTVYKKSDEDRIKNVYAYDMNPGQLKTEELPRMQKISKNFTVYLWIEMALTLAGVVLVFYFRSRPDGMFWYGLGTALIIQSVLLLCTDYVAEKRAIVYTRGLESFLKK